MLVQELTEKLTQWLGQQLKESGAKGFVCGLSGGIDSAVAAALIKRVCPDNMLAIIMPCHSNPQDAKDAMLVAENLKVPYKTVVLDKPFEAMVELLSGEQYKPEEKNMAVANIKPRLRMTTLYYHASTLGYLVVGTGNLSELTMGYFTKYGDGGVDLLPLGNLVKHQVKELAEYLGVPRPVIDKDPSAGLWSGQTDEKEMGITYQQLDNYILTGQAEERVKEIVGRCKNGSSHKLRMPALPPK